LYGAKGVAAAKFRQGKSRNLRKAASIVTLQQIAYPFEAFSWLKNHKKRTRKTGVDLLKPAWLLSLPF